MPGRSGTLLSNCLRRASSGKRTTLFVVQADTEGASARELNRTFLSALRRGKKRTTLRAEWISDEGTSERFFDYLLK
jgi:hypothetical protein